MCRKVLEIVFPNCSSQPVQTPLFKGGQVLGNSTTLKTNYNDTIRETSKA
jgi:hypothetical protein